MKRFSPAVSIFLRRCWASWFATCHPKNHNTAIYGPFVSFLVSSAQSKKCRPVAELDRKEATASSWLWTRRRLFQDSLTIHDPFTVCWYFWCNNCVGRIWLKATRRRSRTKTKQKCSQSRGLRSQTNIGTKRCSSMVEVSIAAISRQPQFKSIPSWFEPIRLQKWRLELGWTSRLPMSMPSLRAFWCVITVGAFFGMQNCQDIHSAVWRPCRSVSFGGLSGRWSG